jgi:hypothetical protein
METDNKYVDDNENTSEVKAECNSKVFGDERMCIPLHWRNLPISQQPDYSDAQHLSDILNQVKID